MNDRELEQLYRQAMDGESAPDGLVSDTMALMHQELEKQQAKKATSVGGRVRAWLGGLHGQRRGYAWGFGGLAVAAVLLCVLTLGGSPDTLTLTPFTYQTDSVMALVSRGENSLTDVESELDAKLQLAGCTRTDFFFAQALLSSNEPAMWLAVASYDSPEPFEVTIANFQTQTYRTLAGGQAARLNGLSVYAGQDEAGGDVFAVWQQEERYVQVRLFGECDAAAAAARMKALLPLIHP